MESCSCLPLSCLDFRQALCPKHLFLKSFGQFIENLNHVLTLSFSIRNRIESSATQYHRRTDLLCADFQYPQSDRIVCNVRRASPVTRSVALSVSAIGSNRLQLPLRACRVRTIPPFSIRNRIESSATSAADLVRVLQHVFQYPQSDRIVCNGLVAMECISAFQLSVSAIGSNRDRKSVV